MGVKKTSSTASDRHPGSSDTSRRGSTAIANIPPRNVPAQQQQQQQPADVVSRHLVQPSDVPSEEAFNSLQLQGGDITREVYKWQDQQQQPDVPSNAPPSSQAPSVSGGLPDWASLNESGRPKRSHSFSGSVISHGSIISPEMSAEQMRAPQGFRRSFLVNKSLQQNGDVPNFTARNFYEFLTLYGHFAGEDLSDDEDDDTVNFDEEHAALLPRREARKARKAHKQQHKSSTGKAVLLLLKSFIGTGVLFLPRAFQNGGWVFSTLCMLLCGIVSFYCFILLINAKQKLAVKGYGDLGAALYGRHMRSAILTSIVLSQIGFAAAYVVFTATNLQVFFANVFGFQASLTSWLVMQLIIFMPLSLTRNISKLSGTALIADLFILLGLLYVYYCSGSYVVHHGVASDTMTLFNKKDWTLFIGTAIFTFEGVGLLIPIQESMKEPEKFNKCLFGVMATAAFVFISSGLLSYAAFGDKVETVILLNFPQDSVLTAGVQLLYALAILLSTPLQLFPAIRILETWIFPANASGKHNPRVKWSKNYFRIGVVLINLVISWLGARDLDKFVSIVGSFACVPLIYVYPPLLHYKAFRNGGAPRWSLILDQVIGVVGFVIMVYTSFQAAMLWLS
ncbi:LAMI_0F11870g1_1 [Lachancea mirantina]|uniref:LAMI_0F11870g1_1 n=1 Tax=Lachancea mirantina TaxID=1230905 RepID=A0A1G4K2N1_9SACH|nr:LAMI_0F11870g1_1 [Lachancea mirantina]